MILSTRILADYDMCMQTSKVYDCLPIIYPILGLNGEAGEAAEKVKKCLRDNNGDFDGPTMQEIKRELADVLWYIWAAADDMDTSLDEIMSIGIQKVKERQKTNTVHGSGDDREKLIQSPINNELDLSNKSNKNAISIIGENKSFTIIKDKLKNECKFYRYPNVKINLTNDLENVEFKCKLIGFGRLDSSLLIKCDNTESLNNLIKLMDDYKNYACFINEDILYERRIQIIPTIK